MGKAWKIAATGVAVAALTVGTTGAAWGHECYNASRSAKGDDQAAKSQAWTLTSDIVFMYVVPDELGTALTPQQLAEAQSIVAAEKASGDEDLAELYAMDRAVLMTAVAMNGNSRDGYTDLSDDDKGIEHIFADFDEMIPLILHLMGIVESVTAE